MHRDDVMKDSIEQFRALPKTVKRRKVVSLPADIESDRLLTKADEALDAAKKLCAVAQDLIAEARRLKNQ